MTRSARQPGAGSRSRQGAKESLFARWESLRQQLTLCSGRRSLWALALLPLLLSACVSPPEPKPVPIVEGERLLAVGLAAYQADNYAQAADGFARALRHYQGLDHRRGILESHINLAETALAVRNYSAAARHIAAAAAIAETEGWAGAARRIRLLQAAVAIGIGRVDDAIAQLEPLLPPEGSGGDEVAIAALADRAMLALGGPDADAWVHRFAMTVGRQGGSPALHARLERCRAALAVRDGDPGTAETLYASALERYTAIPSRRGFAATLEAWGETLAGIGETEAAARRYRAALNVRLWLMDRHGTSSDLLALAQIYQAAGEADRATAFERWAGIAAGPQSLDWAILRSELLPY